MRRTGPAAFLIAVVLATFHAHVFSQELTFEEEAKDDHQEDLIGHARTPVDMASAILAVETYVYGRPPTTDSLRILDRKKNKLVTLTMDRIDTKRIKRLGDGDVAISARFTSDEGTPYTLSFAIGENAPTDRVLDDGWTVEIDALDQMLVKDVTIQSVDGKARYTWEKEDGTWTMVRAPSAESGAGH